MYKALLAVNGESLRASGFLYGRSRQFFPGLAISRQFFGVQKHRKNPVKKVVFKIIDIRYLSNFRQDAYFLDRRSWAQR